MRERPSFPENNPCAERIHVGLQHTLHLGNLDSRRDWGTRGLRAGAMADGCSRMSRKTCHRHGKQYSVRDFVVAAGAQLDMKIEWRGEGVEEMGVDARSGRTVVRVDPRYFRPTEVDTLLGDATKARRKLGLDRRGRIP